PHLPAATKKRLQTEALSFYIRRGQKTPRYNSVSKSSVDEAAFADFGLAKLPRRSTRSVCFIGVDRPTSQREASVLPKGSKNNEVYG
ncbi:MAG: hypothetical protein FWG09_04795, partial [Synergistaceae bacterium]|nr:hypothetical protein [Synergistaceae bacterium]